MAKLTVMLTVDLHSADSTMRSDFDKEMKSRKWVKRLSTTTTWTATFKPGIDSAAAVRITRADVAKAARAAGIKSWDALCLPSADSAVEF